MGESWRRLRDELSRLDWPWLEFVTAHSNTPIAGASLFTVEQARRRKPFSGLRTVAQLLQQQEAHRNQRHAADDPGQ
jgi:hypothetical protein